MTDTQVWTLVVAYFVIGWVVFFPRGEDRKTDEAPSTAGRIAADIIFWPVALIRGSAGGEHRGG